jgi:hypothetical protein
MLHRLGNNRSTYRVKWNTIYITSIIAKAIFLSSGFFSLALAEGAPDYLQVNCSNNTYTLYPTTMEANVCEMFRGVTTCSKADITYWDEQYVVWVVGESRFPYVSVYSLDKLTQIYGDHDESRLVNRTGLDLRHQPIVLEENQGPSRRPTVYSMPCSIEAKYFPIFDFRPEAILGGD